MLEAAGLLQEGSRGLVFAQVDLLGQVGVDVLLQAGVGKRRLQRVEVEPLERERGQHQAGRPTFVSSTRRSMAPAEGTCWRVSS